MSWLFLRGERGPADRGSAAHLVVRVRRPSGTALAFSLVVEFLEPIVCRFPVGVESGGNANRDDEETNADAKEASDKVMNW